MATNLHAMMRYRIIDKCLKKPNQAWSWQKLSEACFELLAEDYPLEKYPARRTILKDIQNMRSGTLGYCAPIEYNKQLKGYVYTDLSFSIYNQTVGDKELGEIKNALNILQQFSGNEKIPELQDVLVELEYTLSIQDKDQPETIIHIDESLNVLKGQWLYPILNFINEKKCIRISYQSFGKDKKEYLVSPYFLKKYNGRWNLIGLSHEKNEARTFPLDRILDIAESFKDYIPNNGIDANSYYKDMIGISKYASDQKKEIIKFKALGLNKYYMRSKPIHHSQRLVRETKDHAIFELNVICNYELEMELLARCDEIEIIRPKHLKKKLIERTNKFLLLNA